MALGMPSAENVTDAAPVALTIAPSVASSTVKAIEAEPAAASAPASVAAPGEHDGRRAFRADDQLQVGIRHRERNVRAALDVAAWRARATRGGGEGDGALVARRQAAGLDRHGARSRDAACRTGSPTGWRIDAPLTTVAWPAYRFRSAPGASTSRHALRCPAAAAPNWRVGFDVWSRAPLPISISRPSPRRCTCSAESWQWWRRRRTDSQPVGTRRPRPAGGSAVGSPGRAPTTCP